MDNQMMNKANNAGKSAPDNMIWGFTETKFYEYFSNVL